MTSDSVSPSASEGATTLPWPRFRDVPPPSTAQAPSEDGPWPRWGSLPDVPREDEPLPSLAETPAPAGEASAPAVKERPGSDSAEAPSAVRVTERADEVAAPGASEPRVEAEPPVPEPSANIEAPEGIEDDELAEISERRGPTLLPVRRSVALVPRRRDLSDMTLGEVARAAKKLAPAAIAGAAAAALVTLFRRR